MPSAYSPEIIQAAATIVAAKIAADATAQRPELAYSEIPAQMSMAIGAVIAGINMASKSGKSAP